MWQKDKHRGEMHRIKYEWTQREECGREREGSHCCMCVQLRISRAEMMLLQASAHILPFEKEGEKKKTIRFAVT